MTARARVFSIVALATVAAVAGTVGITLLQTRGERTTAPGAVTKPLKGSPPLFLDFGVRSDGEARALRQAEQLYEQARKLGGNAKGAEALGQADAIFSRYSSLPAQIGLAFARWPKGGLDELKRLVARYPQSAVAELHLGYAFLWSGRNADAVTAWRRAVAAQPDSPAAVDADGALHPSFFPGLPPIVGIEPPAAIAKLPAGAALQALARAARRPDPTAKLVYGSTLWNLSRPRSAERQFEAAARLAPNDPLAQTAAAVGAFTKDAPVGAFGRLGPLTGTFPKAPVVRFHLGLLLLWTGDRAKGVRQLRLAVRYGPSTVWGKQASTLLKALRGGGTK